jgi:hypothetical protein
MRTLGPCLLALSAFASTPALGYCPAPAEPYCVGQPSSFADQASFDLCARSVDAFQRDLETHLACLGHEVTDAYEEASRIAEAAQNDEREAIMSFNAVVEEFNCRASGESYC